MPESEVKRLELRTGFIASGQGLPPVSQHLSRVVLIGHDIELRIVSLVIRCREVANEVLLFDTGSQDDTLELAREVGCQIVPFSGEVTPINLCAVLGTHEPVEGSTLFVPVSSDWKLSDLPSSVNRAREGWDIHHLYRTNSQDTTDEVVFSKTELGHLIVSQVGCLALAKLEPTGTSLSLEDSLKVRLVKATKPIQLPQRQSLATASRFAQLFYWMLESKHPLLLFGIPGIVLFVLGYRLSGDLASMFTELNSTSIGVTLITIAMTLIGLFAMMVALILYIMGKQVARVQHQYNWPKGNA
jgi:hypothetical protein